MVVTPHLVHRWTRGNGGVGASAAEFVSLSCNLDITTLDSCYGTGVANSVGGIGSNDRDRSPISAQIKYAAMGGGAFLHVIVARVSPDLRGGSKPRNRNLLRRPNIWCICDAAPHIDLGARPHCSRICDRIYSLLT